MNDTAALEKTKAVFALSKPSPNDIMYALSLHGSSVRSVANELGVTYQSVSDVIHARRKSTNVATKVSAIIGVPVNKIWPNKYTF